MFFPHVMGRATQNGPPRTFADRRPSWSGVGGRLGIAACVWLIVGFAAAAPASADVSFSGPTNFLAHSGPSSVAVGDFNSDAKLDLAVANSSSNDVSILLGDGSGAFSIRTNFLADSGPQSVAVGDFNRDSHPDLAVANFASNDVSILLEDGTGGFSQPTNLAADTSPNSVAVGDFNWATAALSSARSRP
jgi:hypothetical protein